MYGKDNAMKENKSDKLKQEIFNNVKKFYEDNFKEKEDFIPGKTKINYGGRVFDHEELINLIDASLDFWLTEGKYTLSFQEALASFIESKYFLLTTSGSSANLLASSCSNRKRNSNSSFSVIGFLQVALAYISDSVFLFQYQLPWFSQTVFF